MEIQQNPVEGKLLLLHSNAEKPRSGWGSPLPTLLGLGLFPTLPRAQSWHLRAEHSNSSTEPGRGELAWHFLSSLQYLSQEQINSSHSFCLPSLLSRECISQDCNV